MNIFGLIIGGIIVAMIAAIAFIIYKIVEFMKSLNPLQCTGDSECATNEYCGGVPVKCRPKGAVGESCGEDRACESGACGDLSFKCSPPLDANGKKVLGTECAQGFNECGSGLICKMNAKAYSECSNKSNVGESCVGGSNHCLPGLFCGSDSKCKGRGATGAYCNGVAAGGECVSGECGPNSKCQPPRGPNGLKTVGATCVAGLNQCENNLYCGTDSLCTPKSNVGGACTWGSSHCLPGLFCGVDGQCKRPGATGDYCNGAAAGGECASGECGPLSFRCQPARDSAGKKPYGSECVAGQSQCSSNLTCTYDWGKAIHFCK